MVWIKKGESHAFKLVKRLLKAAWVLELVVAVLILAVTLLELFLLGEGTLSQVLGGASAPTPSSPTP